MDKIYSDQFGEKWILKKRVSLFYYNFFNFT